MQGCSLIAFHQSARRCSRLACNLSASCHQESCALIVFVILWSFPDFWSVKNLPGTLTEEDVMGLFCVKSMKWSPCALVNLCSGEGLASASSIGKARLGRATFGSTSVLLFTAGKQAGAETRQGNKSDMPQGS